MTAIVSGLSSPRSLLYSLGGNFFYFIDQSGTERIHITADRSCHTDDSLIDPINIYLANLKQCEKLLLSRAWESTEGPL